MKRKVRDALDLRAPLDLVGPQIHPSYVPPSSTISGKWKAKFLALKKQFAKNEGHAYKGASSSFEHSGLSYWIMKQRKAFQNERYLKTGLLARSEYRINKEQVALLRSVGLELESGKTLNLYRWRDQFALLQKFFRKYHHTRVGYTLNTKEYPQLGRWVYRQRIAYRNEQLGKWKRAKLQSLGFERVVPTKLAM